MVTFVIGGTRSGKSSFALKKASACHGKKAYIATAQALDNEMKARIEKHVCQRGSDWDTYEEPLEVAEVLKRIDRKYSAVILDCLTIWLSNLMLRGQKTEDRTQTIEAATEGFLRALDQFKVSSVCHLSSGFCSLFIVSNEVGMGIVPENNLAREFRDFAGELNQKVAKAADEVYLVTAGIPIKIK